MTASTSEGMRIENLDKFIEARLPPDVLKKRKFNQNKQLLPVES